MKKQIVCFCGQSVFYEDARSGQVIICPDCKTSLRLPSKPIPDSPPDVVVAQPANANSPRKINWDFIIGIAIVAFIPFCGVEWIALKDWWEVKSAKQAVMHEVVGAQKIYSAGRTADGILVVADYLNPLGGVTRGSFLVQPDQGYRVKEESLDAGVR